jgi:peptidoglycan hydrolase CwlO-like protein
MKTYLTIVLSAVSVGLLAVLFVTKHGDNAQIEAGNTSLADCSNRLDTAQTQLAARDSQIVGLNSALAEASTAALASSNLLAEAQGKILLQNELMTGLNHRLDDAKKEQANLATQIDGLNAQIASVSNQLTATQASLTQTNTALVQSQKDYAALEGKFRQDVAARTVAERRFNNLIEVQAQEKKLMKSGAAWVTPESIYAGLNVEVLSNGNVHVIAPE